MGKTRLAVQVAQEALQLGPLKVGIAVSTQLLGDVASAQGDGSMALEYFLKPLKQFKVIEDTRGIAEVLEGLASLALQGSEL
ncbi:MAG: hypothetical protein R2880_02130 [Deinococcales bacterium]